MDLFMGVVLAASGLLAVFGGATGWEWFMTHRKAAALVARVGRPAARAIYVLVGLACLGLGAWFLAWFVWEWRQATPGT
jgi:hypothetical protein